MAFEDELAKHVESVRERLPYIQGEEATKQSLIVPLFQLLGYNVWDPREVQPEYSADFPNKNRKGQTEKVDYALNLGGQPAMFVECKPADAELDNYDGQLARYFNSRPDVRVGLLTNGVRIKVFTDLNQPNVMDEKPWLDFDLRTAKPAEIDALKKFRKSDFIAEQIVELAEEMVYYNVLVPFMSAQIKNPGDQLVRLAANEIPSVREHKITQKVIDRLTPILRKAIQAAILDHVAHAFSTPPKSEESAEQQEESVAAALGGEKTRHIVDEPREGVATTEEELACFAKVQSWIHEKHPDAQVAYRDSQNYLTIMGQNIRKWFMRMSLDHHWSAFRHVKPESAKVFCPGMEIDDGASYGECRVVFKSIADFDKLKSIVLAAFEAEAARVPTSNDSGSAAPA